MKKEFSVLKLTNGFPFEGDAFLGPATSPLRSAGSPVLRESNPLYEVDNIALSKSEFTSLRNDPRTQVIAPSFPTALIAPVDDDLYTTKSAAIYRDDPTTTGTTWGLLATGVSESNLTGQGVTVAVLDTGIDRNHEAFRGMNIVEQDFTGEGNGDNNGHGTHVAGTIFGQESSDFKFGVAPNIEKALIGKVLDRNGRGTTAQIYKAILWAIDQGAHIISMSLGLDFPGAVQRAVDAGIPADIVTSYVLSEYRANLLYLDSLAEIALFNRVSHGSILVAAAGNESNRCFNPDHEIHVAIPAAAQGFISVGALASKGAPHDDLSVACFSNTGANVSAPGVGVISAQAGGGYVALSGTSMATPHVAGVLALWAERQITSGFYRPELLINRAIGQATTTSINASADPADYGAGIIQAPSQV